MPDTATVRDFRRGQILAAARTIVAEQGLDALTIGALEDRLAFTRGVITYHFDNKDEIVAAVLESALAEIDEATRVQVEASDSVAEKVRAVLRTKVRGFLDHREAGLILLSFWGRITSDAKIRAANARLYATYRRQGARLTGDENIAALLVGMVIGIVTQEYFQPGAFDVDAATEEAARCVLARLAK